MQRAEDYQNERLDHLGIVAGVCQELGLAQWLDALEPNQQRAVSYGTSTVAMILNGLGFANRQLYLVPQFFENKPVAHLLGAGISADMLNDDCLGRTLDWLYEHDVTTVFAGIAHQARQRFGITAQHVHVDTTSFSVNGAYETEQEHEHVIAVTYGYSRDHREDLKQWMLALATTHQGDIPLFLQPLSGNRSDKESLIKVIADLHAQLQETEPEENPLYVADSGLYSAENMRQLNQTGVRWVSRVPETSKEAKAAVMQDEEAWQPSADGIRHLVVQHMDLPQGPERWIIVRSDAGIKRALQTARKQADKQLEMWSKKVWHVSTKAFACREDAQQAWEQSLKGLPQWLDASMELKSQAVFEGRGRPARNAQPSGVRWSVTPQVLLNESKLLAFAQRKACFVIASNVVDEAEISNDALINLYLEQGSVERGFRFLKDPLFLASSVFVKKPERIVALSLIMVLALLVYRLAEHRLREQLEATGQTIPNQVNKPTARPTMRWVFQCFEGVELLHIRTAATTQSLVLRLQPLHHQILSLLGPASQQFYFFSD
ncbi:IS1634 family transposase [Ktedonospora formicarum]|uniref:IS4 family transposase n=1 Tax=Ktedonospora formicarum TaxID=2778364 RepID=A0A8J3ICZ5_9CHLR|nr:IS1634 family transposase [Ktedonospora formicarum]GHO44321.1 IS4 family transposase [Ktedonospora formicarum]GHO47263.1 IS4 family transposase [Ktedonospora formicarum]GHO47590.1 IS4 family transposase [Ktedonospora formicarum]GHO48467.1 IS4 family transposase [Ktedonospora formicarum]GHO49046.1 IS4 family transposase [Ktedonospora formicarum]